MNPRSSRAVLGRLRPASLLSVSFVCFVACGLALLLAVASVSPRVAAASGDRWRGIKPAGETERRTYDVDDFHSLSVDGVAEIDLKVGPDCLVELETDANFVDYVRVRERDGVLILDQENDLPNLNTDSVRFHFRITMPKLTRLEVDGVAEIEGAGLDGGKLRIRADGVANIELKGEVDELDVEVDGVADLDLRHLSAEAGRVRVNGVGNVVLTVTEALDAAVNGMGEIEYYGDPESVRKSVDGFGSIKPH